MRLSRSDQVARRAKRGALRSKVARGRAGARTLGVNILSKIAFHEMPTLANRLSNLRFSSGIQVYFWTRGDITSARLTVVQNIIGRNVDVSVIPGQSLIIQFPDRAVREENRPRRGQAFAALRAKCRRICSLPIQPFVSPEVRPRMSSKLNCVAASTFA